ncbi:hypothetical protein [Phenylobacterium sp.]|jgi:hypothetical protein
MNVRILVVAAGPLATPLLTLAGSEARGYDRGRPMLRELQVKQLGDAT